MDCLLRHFEALVIVVTRGLKGFLNSKTCQRTIQDNLKISKLILTLKAFCSGVSAVLAFFAPSLEAGGAFRFLYEKNINDIFLPNKQ